jgi:group I intron endonuclease
MVYFIYRIRNVINGKVYVGSTKNLKSRWCDHRSSLRRGTNSSRRLQSEWEIFGDNSFAFELLEETNEVDRFIREQHYMDLYKAYEEQHGYNMSRSSDRTLGRRHTDEAKRKMSESHSGKRLSEEHRKKISDSLKGRPTSEEHRRNLILAWEKRHDKKVGDCG